MERRAVRWSTAMVRTTTSTSVSWVGADLRQDSHALGDPIDAAEHQLLGGEAPVAGGDERPAPT